MLIFIFFVLWKIKGTEMTPGLLPQLLGVGGGKDRMSTPFPFGDPPGRSRAPSRLDPIEDDFPMACLQRPEHVYGLESARIHDNLEFPREGAPRRRASEVIDEDMLPRSISRAGER